MKQVLIAEQVRQALEEDIGSGDITAALIPATQKANARIITREAAVLCGCVWVEEVFKQLDPAVKITWHANDGDKISAKQTLCELQGPARSLLSGERVALNFLQTLSATATTTHQYAELIKDLPTKLLDTRKTLPGWRVAQKHAVRCGGGHNHRMGLYDAFLIKENHIASCGSIAHALQEARKNYPDRIAEVEVENFEELNEALENKAEMILLDNFSLAQMKKAVAKVNGCCKLEASGGISLKNLREVALTGVDYVSVGAITKNIQAIDLSMQFEAIK